MQFKNIYQNRRVLVTGHTGFKGSWLSLWLHELGAIVSGIALAPTSVPNHWDLLNLPIASRTQDIRDFSNLQSAVAEFQPEIIFHLAAQPLVRQSYDNPLETWSTNVIGTANILEVCRHVKSIKAIVVVTTDKCYENKEWSWGYREIDALGGHDPYSASKAASELVAASFRNSFFSLPNSPLLATARAGNVIGGGDWSVDRLIPDLIRAVTSGDELEIRNPNATRPWQHVLESLSGYLLLGQLLLQGRRDFAAAWNFGSSIEGNRSVRDLLESVSRIWPECNWRALKTKQPHEAQLLYLDCSKARSLLDWKPVWDFNETLVATVAWYQAWLEGSELSSRQQLISFISQARKKGMTWSVE